MVITSLENDKVKNLVKLQKKKYRDLTNTYIVEGEHLVMESDRAGVIDEVILLDDEEYIYNYPVTYVTYDILKKISTMDNPPKIMAVCNKKNDNRIIGKRVLVLDEVQDPGNLGTIIRSSLAFNVDTIVLLENSVDLYNPKVLRATQGMYNHINIVSSSFDNVYKYMKDNNIPIYGTSVVNGVDVSTIDKELKVSYCLVMGNEGQGVKKEIIDKCDKNLYIKMNEKVESLNVGVACSILLYELRG